MEKLLFVIPKVFKNGLLKRSNKVVTLILMCVFLGVFAMANTNEYGCRLGSRIYQNYDTAHVAPTNFQFDSDGNGSPNGYANLGERCDNGSAIICTLYAFDEITIMGYGILADHSIDYCSIDDYVLTLLIFAISFTLFKIRGYP
jgi:hypothetical protein